MQGTKPRYNRHASQKVNAEVYFRHLVPLFSTSWNLIYYAVTENTSQYIYFNVSTHTSLTLNPTFGVISEYKGFYYGSWVDILFQINRLPDTDFSDFDRKYLLADSLFRQKIIDTTKSEIMIDMAALRKTKFSVKVYNVLKYEGDEYNIKKTFFFMPKGITDTNLQRNKHLKFNSIPIEFSRFVFTKLGVVSQGYKFYMNREISMSFMVQEPVYLLFQESTSHIFLSKNIDTLNIYQFPHNYKRIYVELCKSNELLKLYSYCLNITIKNSPNKYLFIRGNIKCNVELYTCNFLAMPLSWNDASDMCEHFGGYLPILRNKDEMEEFISLIKSTKGLPVIENVLIGLHYYKVG